MSVGLEVLLEEDHDDCKDWSPAELLALKYSVGLGTRFLRADEEIGEDSSSAETASSYKS